MNYITDICLICLEHSNNPTFISCRDTNGISIEDKLKYLLPEIDFNLDNSKYICAKCGNNLSFCYGFKQKCLQNITTYIKYLTIDNSNKYLSSIKRPDFVYKEAYILEPHTEIKFVIANNEEVIITEEPNEELKLNDEVEILLHEVKEEKSKSDNNKNENIILTESNNKCHICHKIFLTKVKLMSHTRLHDLKQYKCEICNKLFNYAGNLTTHKLTHTNNKPYACKICKRSFRQLQHVKTHQLVHTGEKPHTCEVCKKSFRRLQHLKDHQLIHTGEKPHTCEVCNKSFIKLSNLKKHHLIHTGEKPHTCEVCNKSFIRLSNLKKHHLIHTGEGPFTCKFCNKSFGLRANLQQHLKFESDECVKSALEQHVFDLHRENN